MRPPTPPPLLQSGPTTKMQTRTFNHREKQCVHFILLEFVAPTRTHPFSSKTQTSPLPKDGPMTQPFWRKIQTDVAPGGDVKDAVLKGVFGLDNAELIWVHTPVSCDNLHFPG